MTDDRERPSAGFALFLNSGEGWNHRPFLTLASAARAVERARARGASPFLQLVELLPLCEVQR